MKMNTGLFQPTSSDRKDSASVQLLKLHMRCYFQKVFRYEHSQLTLQIRRTQNSSRFDFLLFRIFNKNKLERS